MCQQVNQVLYRRGFSPSFQQNFEPKEWINGLGLRARQRWPTFPKHVLFVTSPSEKPHRNPKFFFSISTTRLAESVEGLNSSPRLRFRKNQSPFLSFTLNSNWHARIGQIFHRGHQFCLIRLFRPSKMKTRQSFRHCLFIKQCLFANSSKSSTGNILLFEPYPLLPKYKGDSKKAEHTNL